MLTQTPPRKSSFLQRSASIASLVAWKARFESYSGKFSKEPSFISYALDNSMQCKLVNETDVTQYNYGPENDLPPDYCAAMDESPPPFLRVEERNQHDVSYAQNFTELENYLKKKLSVHTKVGTGICTKLETTKVFQWISELPEGDNLEEFLEAYGIPTKGVDMCDLKEKLKIFLDERLSGLKNSSKLNEHLGKNEIDTVIPHWKRQMANLEVLAHDDNLEKWLESLDVPYFKPIPETKMEIRKYLQLPAQDETQKHDVQVSSTPIDVITPKPTKKEMEELVPKWKELIEKMGELKTDEGLDKWLQNLELPHNVQKAKMHAEIKKFFRHERFENFNGKSIIFQEQHLAKVLWDKFEDSGLLKQVGIVAGTTAMLGLVAVLSTTMLSFAVPAVFAFNPFFVEIFAQYFLQRQEVAFNLLNFHATQAKPLSTAWAKQYVLWKYC